MIPVLVGNRIIDRVDAARADCLSHGANVKAIRAKGTRAIVRLIITPRELGDGRARERSESGNSRKATYIERLFTDHEPSGPVAGYPFLFQLKSSTIFRDRRAARRAPTTTSVPAPARRNKS